MTMDKHYPDGLWYVFSQGRREFLKLARVNYGRYKKIPVGAYYTRWKPGMEKAMAFKNPSTAKYRARQLNEQDVKLMCRAVDTRTALVIMEVIEREKAALHDI